MVQNKAVQIVYIEDSRPDVYMFNRAAKQYVHPITLTVLTDGNQAMEFIQQEGQYSERTAPSFILLDLNMPFVSGFDILTAIRMHPQLRFTPVIIVTSSRDEDDLRRSYELGANAYVMKLNKFYEYQKSVINLLTFWLDTAEVPRV
jgi:two-component system, chemotaxis family, response regulator Rcp1